MQNKKYNVIVSERASAMFVNHIKFLTRVSYEAAQRLRKEIIKEIQELEFMPEKYPWLLMDEIPAYRYRKKLVEKRYLIIYQIKNDTVAVDYILDCRQDYKWLM